MSYVGNSPVPRATRVLTEGVLGSETDTITVPGGYVAENLAVHMNGYRLPTDQYNDSDGISVILSSTFPEGTEYVIEEFRQFEHANHYTKTEADDRFVNETDITGTVSESGGVPTGAIIERGSSANGEFVKYADGTLICWQTPLTASFNDGNFLLGTWTFPETFSSSPLVIFNVTPSNADTASVYRKAGIVGPAGETTTSVAIRVAATVGNDWVSGDELTSIRGYAIGRWF